MFFTLYVTWLIFAGSITVLNLVLGIFICGLITLFCNFFMKYGSSWFPSLKKVFCMINYISVLIKEIIKSNMEVIRLIYSKKTLNPKLVYFETELRNDGLKVLVANSITLTPGTCTAVLEGQEYVVHALDESLSHDIPDNIFFQTAKKMEN